MSDSESDEKIEVMSVKVLTKIINTKCLVKHFNNMEEYIDPIDYESLLLNCSNTIHFCDKKTPYTLKTKYVNVIMSIINSIKKFEKFKFKEIAGEFYKHKNIVFEQSSNNDS